jgi:hypothetical protein
MYVQKKYLLRSYIATYGKLLPTVRCNFGHLIVLQPQMAPKNSKVAAKNLKYDALILWIVEDALK